MDARNLIASIDANLLRDLSDQQQSDLGMIAVLIADEFPARQGFMLGVAHGIALERERREQYEIEKLKEMLG